MYTSLYIVYMYIYTCTCIDTYTLYDMYYRLYIIIYIYIYTQRERDRVLQVLSLQKAMIGMNMHELPWCHTGAPSRRVVIPLIALQAPTNLDL